MAVPSIPHAEPGRQPLGQAFSQFTPQHARRGAGGFLQRRCQFDELADVLLNVAGRERVQIRIHFKKGCIIADPRPFSFVVFVFFSGHRSG